MDPIKATILGQLLCRASSNADLNVMTQLIDLGAPPGGHFFIEGVPDLLKGEPDQVLSEFEGAEIKIEGVSASEISHCCQEAANLSGYSPQQEELPLFCAINSGSIEAVDLLIQLGADIQVKDECGCSLIYAAQTIEMIEHLCGLGFNLEDRDHHDNTPLMDAVMWGRIKQAFTFIKAGANSNAVDNEGFTVFLKACFSPHPSLECVKALMDCGVDPHAVSKEGFNAFHLSVGSVVSSDEYGAREQVLRFLKTLNVSLEQRDFNGLTPLGHAVLFEDSEVVQLLCEMGANPNVRSRLPFDNYSFAEGQPEEPILFGCFNGFESSLGNLKLLIQAGVDLDVVDSNGRTALEFVKHELNCAEEEELSEEEIEFLKNCLEVLTS